MTKIQVYWFNWPSKVGGADTKFTDLIPVLAGDFHITVVPNSRRYFASGHGAALLEQARVRTACADDLPGNMSGWAVSLCNGTFLTEKMPANLKRRGLKVAWSSEMMWHFPQELATVEAGHIDKVLYVSSGQRLALEPGYRKAIGASPEITGMDADSGVLEGAGGRRLPWVMTGNYIDPAPFPYRDRNLRNGQPFTVGRLSRPAPDKFPDNFPKSYERLGLQPPVKFRVMGWSEKLTERWSEHDFDDRWDLVSPAAEPAAAFLQSLDVLVYDVSPRFKESWGRAVVEAMLTGVVPLVPRGGGHHLENLLEDGVSGFLCSGPEDYSRHVCRLQSDSGLLETMSRAARDHALRHHCSTAEHRRLWRMVFD